MREGSWQGHRDSHPRSRSPTRRRERHSTRSRSRSPGQDHHGQTSRRQHRTRSPEDDSAHHRRHRRNHHHHHHRSSRKHASATSDIADNAPAELPFDARPLSKSDYAAFRHLLAYYLDLQKGKSLARMDEREARGRWKSFVGKWNRGELMEGWYDPEMFVTARERMMDDLPASPSPEPEAVVPRSNRRREEAGDDYGRDERRRGSEPSADEYRHERNDDIDMDDDDDDDDMGPAPPPTARANTARPGPGIPSLDDLSAAREERHEEAVAAREARISDLQDARAADRKEQRERLEELVPRADPGTRERRMEKRAAVNEKMRGFRERSPGDAAVGDGDLMGDDAEGGGGLASLKAERAREERRKTERELRREEIARAKAEEQEERVRLWREREEGTMAALKELARQRFG